MKINIKSCSNKCKNLILSNLKDYNISEYRSYSNDLIIEIVDDIAISTLYKVINELDVKLTLSIEYFENVLMIEPSNKW